MAEDKITNLEKEIKRLSVKLETLVNYLNTQGEFGPPDGRDRYDAMVKRDLAEANL
jgi:hypothetical protein